MNAERAFPSQMERDLSAILGVAESRPMRRRGTTRAALLGVVALAGVSVAVFIGTRTTPPASPKAAREVATAVAMPPPLAPSRTSERPAVQREHVPQSAAPATDNPVESGASLPERELATPPTPATTDRLADAVDPRPESAPTSRGSSPAPAAIVQVEAPPATPTPPTVSPPPVERQLAAATPAPAAATSPGAAAPPPVAPTTVVVNGNRADSSKNKLEALDTIRLLRRQ